MADRDHKMTLWQVLRQYPKACEWSILISTACAMEGYNISVVGILYKVDLLFVSFDLCV
jgi:SP family general alpha glucoside:H+ symporter-like MFS transporter